MEFYSAAYLVEVERCRNCGLTWINPQELELMQYLTTCGVIGVKAMINDNWDHAEAVEAAAAKVTPADFAAAMDRQMAELEKDIRAIPEKDLATRPATMPWGAPTVLGISLVDCGLKPLVAYRMQFFLYAKEAGNPDIGPADCWAGVSPPKK